MFEFNNMIKNRRFLKLSKSCFPLLLLSLIFILGACGPAGEEEENPTTPAPDTTPYPSASESSTGESIENDVYPAPGVETAAEETTDPYPPPTASDKPAFQLDLPLTPGATTVTGQAPDGLLPLAIVDITFGGVILGTGQSDEDGRFSIPVTPLPEGHRVGVTVTEIEAGITFEEIAEQYFPYRGDEFMNVPNIGIFYDTAMTEP